jgi:hypothetical protein
MMRICAGLILLGLKVGAVELAIDYSYDTSGFFNVAERRGAIEAVADFYGALIRDNLLKIDPAEFPGSSWTATFTHPATGGAEQVENLIVPEDTIIIFVGARNLSGSTLGIAGPGGFGASGFSQAWFDRIRGRGNPGAEPEADSEQTDFAPWGGSATFDADRTWNFSLSGNQTGAEFVAVALHELGHVLGIGTAASWNNLISANQFAGESVLRSYDGALPVTPDFGHIGGGLTSRSFGSFGVGHGLSRAPIMQPSISDNGSTFLTASDVDLAALADIGWEVLPVPEFLAAGLGTSSVTVSWNATGFLQYQVERAGAQLSFAPLAIWQDGSGLNMTFQDTAPPVDKGFYRLGVREHPVVSVASLASPVPDENASIRQITVPEILVEGCGH